MSDTTEFDTAYLATVDSAMEELSHCRSKLKELRSDERQLEQRIRKLVTSILALNALLPTNLQKTLAQIQGQDVPMISPESGSEVYQRVVETLKSDPKKEWRPRDLQAEVESTVVGADPKQLYNALQRLTDRGAAVRLRHGLYRWGGAVIETADEIGGEPPIQDE